MQTYISLIYFFLLMAPLYGAGNELQKLSHQFEEMQYQLNHHKSEIDLFHDRIKSLEEKLQEGLTQLTKSTGKALDPSKLKSLEEGQKSLVADLKMLKNELTQAITKQTDLEKTFRSQMKEVQQNLEKVVQLLSGEKVSNSYTVKAGDSLGLIAQQHKVTIKVLRELNQLSNDQIYVGQKLKVP